MKRTTALLFLSLVASGPSLAQAPPPASFEEAMTLYQDGRYADAKPIADNWATKDDPRAYLMLGTMAQKGLGVEVDLKQAQIWFEKGAEKGDVDCQLALAMLYLTGTGQKPNVDDGAPWLKKAAESGNVKAQYNFGLYYTGLYGTPPDWDSAAKWFKAAADKESARAQYNLALLFIDGKGVPKDQLTAANLFSKAAVQGMPEAALEYGVMVFRGEGVAKDEAVGAKWLLIAAQHGNAVAQNRLARILGLGVPGVPQDPIEAMKWNFVAKKAGRGDIELDAATEKADPGMVLDAKARAEAFKPLPDRTPD
ncbi:tetratricopeptide repeat protein [Aestuariivirga litoralis]|uniref:tetratricopeptide repeat protein n=1 Tax=Aestuariivirga litoralis TaxID=2650924 RepID=UPI0018C773FC|nr:tetratricopeptide repeat protein [Aestuariivirga litoralis]MBG1232451.1 sel1 repeat family protein [Aestuariivirga litoralis]